MAALVDTSVLTRLANQADPAHAAAVLAISNFHRDGDTLVIAPQNLVEFRSVATRPTAVNGLGLSTNAAESKAAIFEAVFSLLPETPDIFPTWKGLVAALNVVGKQVHDARLVACCLAHGVSHLLTFNTSHFARLANYRQGVVIVSPVNDDHN